MINVKEQEILRNGGMVWYHTTLATHLIKSYQLALVARLHLDAGLFAFGIWCCFRFFLGAINFHPIVAQLGPSSFKPLLILEFLVQNFFVFFALARHKRTLRVEYIIVKATHLFHGAQGAGGHVDLDHLSENVRVHGFLNHVGFKGAGCFDFTVTNLMSRFAVLAVPETSFGFATDTNAATVKGGAPVARAAAVPGAVADLQRLLDKRHQGLVRDERS